MARKFLSFFCPAWFALIFISAVLPGPIQAFDKPPLHSAAEIDYPPFSYVGEHGRAVGFSVELLQAALAAMGRDVRFKTGPWKDVRSWLEKGEIDALPLVGRTPERETLFDFTFPYMSLYGAIVVRKADVGRIWDLKDLKGRIVAVMKGDNAEEFLRREDRGIQLRTTPSFTDAFQLLSEGGCDAVVVQRLVALRLIRETGIAGLSIVNRPIEEFRQDFCFAVTEGDRDTLALLNEGLALVTADGTFRHLHAKWFASLELPEHRRIIIGGDYNFPPFEYLDENGRPAGFNVDLTRAIARETGMDIEIRLGPWSKIREDLADGSIDGIQGMFYSPERDRIFDFTPAHIVNHCVVVVRKDRAAPLDVNSLAGLDIVVQKGDILHDFAVENGLAEHLRLADAQEDALRELAEGKHDCALVARMTALYWIKKYGWKNLRVGDKPLLSPEYCFSVPGGNRALLAQLSEGLKIIHETGEYRRIYEKWMGGYASLNPDYLGMARYAAIVLTPLVVLLLGFYFWNRSLRKQVALRTEALRQSLEFQRAMIECSPVALYSVDNGGLVTAWNASAERVLGWRADEIMGTPLPIVPQDRIQEFSDIRGRIIAGEILLNLEVVRRKKDGALFDGSLSAAPIRDKNGRIIGIMAAMEDITSRKQAAESLKKSEAQYRLLADNTMDAIWTLDLDLVFTYINPACFAITGYTQEEWIGSRLQDHCDTENLKIMTNNITNGLKIGPKFRGVIFEAEMIKKNGETLPVEIHGKIIFNDAGNPLMIQGITRDITERRKLEETLRQSEEKFRSLFENHSAVKFIIDPENGTIIEANESAARFYGWPVEQLRGMRVSQMNILLTPEEITREMEKARDLKKNHFEFKHRKAGGDIVDVEVFSSKVIIGGKEYLHSIVHDITEKRTLENQLHQAQKMESVGRLAGGVAHDFNNMLSVILGYSELVLEKIPPDDPLYEDIGEIQAAGRRAADVTRQLLAFARRQTIAPKILDLNETVEGMLRMLRRLIGEEIDLSWHPRPELWPVRMDPVQIDQVLANLCVNAKDAIAGLGRITIETEHVSFDETYCEEHPGFVQGDFVMLAVTDNGCGMDAETLEKIYEPFFTTKGVGEGTGLGLPTVYGIVKQNKGFINVYSEPGSGTTFRLYFPRHVEPLETVAVPRTETFPEGAGETVLVVEDDAMILAMAEKMLGNLGYHPLAAASPAEALKLAGDHEGHIDLVMTDVIMPVMNGRELSEKLRGLYPDLRVLFMSGYTANVIAHHGVLEDGVLFIQKPFSRTELAKKVREALLE